jgi:CheY-like chemotaxis protein
MVSTAVLYVEDEEADALLLSLAFKRAHLPHPIHTVIDGVEAIDYLAGKGSFADREHHPFPALVLLDLKLPRKSGFDVLEWARQQPGLAALPIVIYTSSDRETDRARAMELGASAYIVKRSNIDQLGELVRALSQRWLASIHSA